MKNNPLQAELFWIEPDPDHEPPNTFIDRNIRIQEAIEKKRATWEHKKQAKIERQVADAWMSSEPISQAKIAELVESGARKVQMRRIGLTSPQHITERTAVVNRIAYSLKKNMRPEERLEFMYILRYRPRLAFLAIDTFLIPLCGAASKELSAGIRVNRTTLTRDIVRKLYKSLFLLNAGENIAY